MSSIIKLQQRIAELAQVLTNNHDLTEEQRDAIENEMLDIEDEMDDAINPHHNEEDY